MPLKEFTPKERTVVGIGQPVDWRDPPTVVIGVSEDAFAAMEDGRTHTHQVDANGMMVNIILFREKTLAECRAKLTETGETLGLADHELPIVGIPEKKGH